MKNSGIDGKKPSSPSAFALILALAILPVATGPAFSAPPPLRVLVPPAPFRPPPESLQDPHARASLALSRHLYDWLERAPEVQLVDVGQAEALLAPILRRLHADKAAGVAFDGTVGIQRSELPGLLAVTSSNRAAAPVRVSGVDPLTGIRSPELPPGRTGALAPRDVRGVYLAAANGVAVLAERPLEAAEPVAGGLRIKSSGLVRAVSESGPVLAARLDGGTLPTLPDEEMLEWLFNPEMPGLYSKPQDGTHITLVRAPGGVTLTQKSDP